MIRDSFFGALRTKIASAEKRSAKIANEPKGLEAQLYDQGLVAIEIQTLKDVVQKAMAEIFEPDPVAAALISRDYASMFHLMAVQPIIEKETHNE